MACIAVIQVAVEGVHNRRGEHPGDGIARSCDVSRDDDEEISLLQRPYKDFQCFEYHLEHDQPLPHKVIGQVH